MQLGRELDGGAETRSTSGSARSTRAGFTLIEVLAAFVILALLTISIQIAAMTATSNIAAARARFAAQTVASSLISGMIVVPEGGVRRTAGNLNGYEWTIEFDAISQSRFAAPSQPIADFGWAPVQVHVEVRRPGSDKSLATLETVRLVRVTP